MGHWRHPVAHESDRPARHGNKYHPLQLVTTGKRVDLRHLLQYVIGPLPLTCYECLLTRFQEMSLGLPISNLSKRLGHQCTRFRHNAASERIAAIDDAGAGKTGGQWRIWT
ncbi:hypothetical protein PR202_ga21066 [Eleusine coracana subsp. coracana]|uniref:Uncharacterized protein n=1 Tax=Eleusine coracana subsp. coracana TaxID=191504 RepID=A0AAV5CYQ2_ELECO|nr:hypothetical protein PR202_ga21066 [Eleusine coracana subsp. coracana]